MTKREVRILTISLLGIQEKDVVVDIGAGTGGLTMEAAYAANAVSYTHLTLPTKLEV